MTLRGTPDDFPAPDDRTAVPPGLLCRRCAYDLVGLDVGGVCPECGKPIEQSLRGDLLRDADVEYVRTLEQGVLLVLLGVYATFTSHVITWSLVVVARSTGAPAWAAPVIRTSSLLALFAAACLSVWGWWRFSEPDPGLGSGDRSQRARLLVRITALTTAAATLIGSLTRVLVGTSATIWDALMIRNPPTVVATGLIELVGVCAWIVLFFSGMHYVRLMAMRLPDVGLVTRAIRAMWSLPLWWTLGRILCGLGPLIAMIIYLGLLHDMRTHLRAIIRGQPIIPRRP